MANRDDFATFEEYATVAKAEMRADFERRQAKWDSDVKAMRREHGQDYVNGYFAGMQAEGSEIAPGGWWANELPDDCSEKYRLGFKQTRRDLTSIIVEGIA